MPSSVNTSNAPLVGFSAGTSAPLSQAVVHNGTIYCSGTGPLDPATREVVSDDFSTQVHQTLVNLINVVEAAGGAKDTILKINCYLKDKADFAQFNTAYRAFFADVSSFPARTTVEASAHRPGVRVELDCIAATLETEPRAL